MGSWLSRPREPDYDTVLSRLQEQISARQAKLQQIRLRERRANALFITYGFGLWVLYSVLWWFKVIGANFGPLHMKALFAAPVILLPVVIIFARRFIRWFYHRKQDKEEKTLKVLVKEKQDKVEEIKKKTGYYTTRDLLEKYDEQLRKSAGASASNPATPAKQGTPKPTSKAAIPFPSAPGTPARPASALGFSTPPQQPRFPPPGGPQPPFSPAAGAVAFPPQPPATPQPRTFMDKFADALLGVSPEESSPSKYALICGKCYSHNGLVPPAEFDFVQYQCPRCGFFNPRRRAPSQQGEQSFHRRVQSEFIPSPLARPSAAAEALAGPDDPSKAARVEAERAEEREVAETLLPEQDVGEGQRHGTTALKEGTVASRRRGRKAGRLEDEEGEKDEDRMDTDD
ncbi:hypothetical protein JCM10207_006588 [Rhodosporidiobolus poonsookiae]